MPSGVAGHHNLVIHGGGGDTGAANSNGVRGEGHTETGTSCDLQGIDFYSPLSGKGEGKNGIVDPVNQNTNHSQVQVAQKQESSNLNVDSIKDKMTRASFSPVGQENDIVGALSKREVDHSHVPASKQTERVNLDANSTDHMIHTSHAVQGENLGEATNSRVSHSHILNNSQADGAGSTWREMDYSNSSHTGQFQNSSDGEAVTPYAAGDKPITLTGREASIKQDQRQNTVVIAKFTDSNANAGQGVDTAKVIFKNGETAFAAVVQEGTSNVFDVELLNTTFRDQGIFSGTVYVTHAGLAPVQAGFRVFVNGQNADSWQPLTAANFGQILDRTGIVPFPPNRQDIDYLGSRGRQFEIYTGQALTGAPGLTPNGANRKVTVGGNTVTIRPDFYGTMATMIASGTGFKNAKIIPKPFVNGVWGDAKLYAPGAMDKDQGVTDQLTSYIAGIKQLRESYVQSDQQYLVGGIFLVLAAGESPLQTIVDQATQAREAVWVAHAEWMMRGNVYIMRVVPNPIAINSADLAAKEPGLTPHGQTIKANPWYYKSPVQDPTSFVPIKDQLPPLP